MSDNSVLYAQRFARHRDELEWLFMELYNDRDALHALESMLESAAAARPDALRALDARREADPNWYKGNDLLGMCLYVKPFAGDLKGVESRLDYLSEAGVNYLHLMPLLDTVDSRSDGGYAVASFRKVKPELGTMDDLRALTAACRARGISCCLDFVMNHTSEDHEWAKRARAGEKKYQDYYFFYDNWDIPNEYEKHVPQVFPTTAPGNFTYLEDAKKIVLTSFYPYQWDLNYRNPAVFNAMVDNMLFLANQGIDILRIDAVPYIWKELGTDCRNLPQVHTIVRMVRMICEIVCPGTLLLGEVVMAPEKLAPYFGTTEKPECHMLYNATTMCTTWHTVATQDTRLLRHQLDALAALPKEYVFLNYLRCHDDIGWGLDYPFLSQFGMEEVPHKAYLNAYFTGEFPGSSARGERYNDDPTLGDARLCGTTASLLGIECAEETGDDALMALATDYDLTLHAYMLAQSGVPILYAGDEIGQLNDTTYREDPNKAADSRYLHRGNFRWDLAEKRTDPAARQGKQFLGLLRLEQLRRENPVFCAEADLAAPDLGDDAVLCIRRAYAGQVLYAVINFSSAAKTVQLPASGSARDLWTDEALDLAAPLTLAPCGFRWVLAE